MPAAASMRGKRQALEMGSCLLIEDGGIRGSWKSLDSLVWVSEGSAGVLFFFLCVCVSRLRCVCASLKAVFANW